MTAPDWSPTVPDRVSRNLSIERIESEGREYKSCPHCQTDSDSAPTHFRRHGRFQESRICHPRIPADTRLRVQARASPTKLNELRERQTSERTYESAFPFSRSRASGSVHLTTSECNGYGRVRGVERLSRHTVSRPGLKQIGSGLFSSILCSASCMPPEAERSEISPIRGKDLVPGRRHGRIALAVAPQDSIELLIVRGIRVGKVHSSGLLGAGCMG